jgi:hypothetical protein
MEAWREPSKCEVLSSIPSTAQKKPVFSHEGEETLIFHKASTCMGNRKRKGYPLLPGQVLSDQEKKQSKRST